MHLSLTAYVLILGSIFTSTAFSQQSDPCADESKAAISAVKMRDRGKTKEELLVALPSRKDAELAAKATGGSNLALLMYSIVDDVYANPDVKEFPYFIYRTFSCVNRAAGKKVPESLSLVASDIVTCQSKHGTERSSPLLQCVGLVMENYDKPL